MATGNLLDTKTVNLNEIFGNGKIYRVPQFQRDYSWDQDNWEDLWNDLLIAQNTKKAHYMGSVVLQNSEGKEYQIIDGQQRFTTLSILILAVIRAIKQLADSGVEQDANKERVDILMRQYIGQKDPSSLRYSSKLFLNENNDFFYQSRLLAFKDPSNVKKLSSSETLIWKAYEFFSAKISEKFRQGTGSELAAFLNDVVGELMMFIQIIVKDELNAYTVFETLNSRGVELTSADLLKNFLFSRVSGSTTDLKLVKDQWKKIIDIIGLKDFPVFLRYFLLGTKRQITKEYLFKEVKDFIKDGEQVYTLLEDLEKFAYHFMALGNPEDDFWTDNESRNAISIFKVLRITQWKPLAMVAAGKLSDDDFKKLLQNIITVSYRYTVIAKLQTNEMEKVYSRAAINLHQSKTGNINTVMKDLRDIYVGDEEFKGYFSLKQFNTNNTTDKKLLRYTLYKLEAQEAGGSAYDFETDKGTIEHILPESYPEAWQQDFAEEDYERCIYSLGNLTLLEVSKNSKEAANKSFGEKKAVYQTSKYALTKSLYEDEWNPLRVKHRQAKLAKLATSVWQIQFPD